MEEENEITIFIQTQEEKKYILDIPNSISYKDLKEKIKKLIFKNDYFYIVHNSKAYKKENINDILNLEQGDIIYTYKTLIKENFFEGKFHKNPNVNEADMKTVELSGILKVCLLEFIAKKIENVKIIKNEEIRRIISDLKNEMDLTDNPKNDIKANLSQKFGSNIITFKYYIQELISQKEIDNLINLFDKVKKTEINAYWSELSKYEEFNELFEKDFSKAIEKSYFDYSLISVSIYQQDRRQAYLKGLKECKNADVKYLFHGSQIDPISNIITNGFYYTRKAFYGMGIYFSDMLDYVSFYSGGSNYNDRRKYFDKILPVGETFSCVGAEIYYDSNQKKEIYDWKLHVPELDHFPSYDEIKKKYSDKMVKKNGIHFVRVEPEKGQVIENEKTIISRRKVGKFIGNEYVITEMDQILPLYGLTLKRNEYFVIWRDPHFSGENEFTKYLKNAKMYLYKNESINVYIENTSEKALELIKKKRFNKIILISSIGKDLGGKKFVEIARKILGFDVMVLFFSQSRDHLKWIQNFPNALYTNNTQFYQIYVKNYNKTGLETLKKDIEKFYKVKLQFTDNFLKFPKFINSQEYKDIIFDEISPYFRKIIIKSNKTKKILQMDKNKKIKFVSNNDNDKDKDIESKIWYVTLMNGEITLFSNDFYLSINEKDKTPIAYPFMIIWNFKENNNRYITYYKNMNNVLTVNEDEAIISNQSNNSNQLFDFIDTD